MAISATATAAPTNPDQVATAAITKTVPAAAARYSAPTGPLREAS